MAVASMATDKEYTTAKINREVMRRVKAAAALRGMDAKDYLSELANEPASKASGQEPVKLPKKPTK